MCAAGAASEGYSATPLAQKIGIKPGHDVQYVRLHHGPPRSEIPGLPDGASIAGGVLWTVSYVALGCCPGHGAGYVELDCAGRAVGDRGAAHPAVEGAAAGWRNAGHT